MKKKYLKEFKVYGDGVQDDTANIQNAIEECAKNKCQLVFDNRVYKCGNLYIPNNTFIDFNKSTIICPDTHFMFNFKADDAYLKYKGNGNIHIQNLTIIGGHVASFIHGKNITFDNIKASEPANDHYFEICACKNFVVKNSQFWGVKCQAEDRRFVEMIQIDMCNKNAFPWFTDKCSKTYDKSVNKNILIANCSFDEGSKSTFKNIYTAIGVHGLDKKYHKNITIKNCTIKNASYAAIHGMSWRNVLLSSNTFINSQPCIFENCQNLKINKCVYK